MRIDGARMADYGVPPNPPYVFQMFRGSVQCPARAAGLSAPPFAYMPAYFNPKYSTKT